MNLELFAVSRLAIPALEPTSSLISKLTKHIGRLSTSSFFPSSMGKAQDRATILRQKTIAKLKPYFQDLDIPCYFLCDPIQNKPLPEIPQKIRFVRYISASQLSEIKFDMKKLSVRM
jgi:hypothetical protein